MIQATMREEKNHELEYEKSQEHPITRACCIDSLRTKEKKREREKRENQSTPQEARGYMHAI